MRYEVENVDRVLIENEIVVAHKTDNVHFMDKPHFHDGFEIHFTLTSATTYQIDERMFVAEAGSIALFNPEEIHRVSIDRDKLYERYFVLFKPSMIEEMILTAPFLLDVFNNKDKKDCLHLTLEQQTKLINIFEDLILTHSNKDSRLHVLRTKLKLTELIVLLTELFEDENKNYNAISYGNNHLVTDIISYIKENYMDEISLDSLGEEFFISKSTIIRLFKSVLGMTPNQYLIYTRVMKSRKFLEQGYSVKDVADKVGYRDESSFIKKFKELQGISPKQYALKLLETKR